MLASVSRSKRAPNSVSLPARRASSPSIPSSVKIHSAHATAQPGAPLSMLAAKPNSDSARRLVTTLADPKSESLGNSSRNSHNQTVSESTASNAIGKVRPLDNDSSQASNMV